MLGATADSTVIVFEEALTDLHVVIKKQKRSLRYIRSVLAFLVISACFTRLCRLFWKTSLFFKVYLLYWCFTGALLVQKYQYWRYARVRSLPTIVYLLYWCFTGTLLVQKYQNWRYARVRSLPIIVYWYNSTNTDGMRLLVQKYQNWRYARAQPAYNRLLALLVLYWYFTGTKVPKLTLRTGAACL